MRERNGERSRDERETHLCVFCDIRDGKRDGSVIKETENVIAIMALEGHPLVMPKKHTTVQDVEKDPTLMLEAYEVAHSLVGPVKDVMDAEGVTLVENLGEAAGQDIDHVHIHVFPRVRGDREITYRLSDPLPRAELNRRAQVIFEATPRS